MSDDKSPLDDQPAAEPTPLESRLGQPKAAPSVSPALVMGLVAIVLLGVLIVMAFNNASKTDGKAGSDDGLKELQAEVDARRTELNRQRQAMGLSPVEGGSEAIGDIADRLKKDADSLVALSSRFQQMLSEKDLDISAKTAEIIRSEKLRQTLVAESSRLQSELQRALVGGSDADRLRQDLADVRAQRDALSTELTAARQDLAAMSKGVSSEDFTDLKRRFEETLRAKEFFEGRVRELEGDLSTAKLFASSETELVPAAVALFKSLRGLEGLADSEITTSYSSLGVDLGANVVHTLSFATGSAALSAEDENVIRNLSADVPDGDLLLVVGYASETGNAEENQRLSSDRATSVAQFYTGVKRPGQLVQAVYLGQTDRFSSRIPERNQLVEVWRIRKK